MRRLNSRASTSLSGSAQLRFGLEPVVEVTALRLAAFDKNLICARGNLLVGGSGAWIGYLFSHVTTFVEG